MVKHIQTIRRQQPTNCLSVFDHFVGLALKGLNPSYANLPFLYITPKSYGFLTFSGVAETENYRKTGKKMPQLNIKKFFQ